MSTGINIDKSIKVVDESTQITDNASQLTFTGTGVTASAVGGNVTVNIPGGSAGTVTNVTGTAPIASSGGTTPAISIANAAANGTTKGAATFTANDFSDNGSGVISLDYDNGQKASATQPGFLSQGDFSTFSGKQDALGFTPEDVANKQSNLTASATKYPTVDAVNTGLSTKENIITAGTTSQYYRGDKTFQTLDKTAVGLANVDNTSDLNKPISTATQTALNSKQDTLGFTPENVSNKSTDVNLGSSNTLYPTQNAVKTYTDNILGNANALVYKGTIDCSMDPNYPAADAGWMYIVSVAGKIGGGSGTIVEVGDMLICNTDSSPAGTQAGVGANWNIIEKNIVGAVTGPASSTNNNVAFFDGATGKIIKDSGITLSGTNTGDQTLSGLGGVPIGAITGSGLTMATNRLLGRTSAGTAGVEEISVGTGLTLSAGTLSAISSSGVWGISDSSGVYTYYATLTSAMSAATSGQTIEMFADVTESSNVTISLKHGVNINGNGHTYTYTNNSGTMFTCATVGNTTGTIIIENLNIVRTNTASTGASIFSFTGSAGFATTRLYLPGSFVRYTVTSGNSPVIIATDPLNTLIVDGLFCITNGGGTAVTGNTTSTTTNSYIECTGTSVAFSSGTIRNSRITTTSGTAVASGTAISCVISCTTSGVGVNEGNASNSIINTNTGNAMQAGSTITEGSASNCTVSSTSGICFRRVIPSNCVASSGSNLVVDHWFNYGGAKFHRNYFATTSTSPVFACAGGTMELVDSTIIQNGTGPGIRVTGASNQDVINCTVIVANAAANCLNATAASNSRYINNKFKGATTPVNANVTQTVTNTIDNQGNILL